MGPLGQGAIKMPAVMFQMVLEKGIDEGWGEFSLQSKLLVEEPFLNVQEPGRYILDAVLHSEPRFKQAI